MINIEKLNSVPNNPGVYLWKDKYGEIIYVGKAKNLQKRMKQYFQKNISLKTQVLVKNIDSFDYFISSSEMDALLQEINLIDKYNPKYNVKLKEAKSYPYIKLIIKETKITLSLTKIYKKDNSFYFGPFPEGFAPSKIIKLLKETYPINKCLSPKKGKPCINYQLNKCLGECVGNIDKNQVKIIGEEIKSFFSGNLDIVRNKLILKMEENTKALRYEESIKIKSSIELIEQYKQKQKTIFKDSINRDVISFTQEKGIISLSISHIRYGNNTNTSNFLLNSFSIEPIETVEQFLLKFYKISIIPSEIITSFNTNINELLNIKLVFNPKEGIRKSILNNTIEHSKNKLKENFYQFEIESRRYERSIDKLKKILNLKKDIKTIEMIDISNLGNKNQVGVIVSFQDGKPNRNLYRKYNLLNGQDDYNSIFEVTFRHFNRKIIENKELPDLFIVDGKNQINNAQKAIEKLNIEIPIIGLVKNSKHRTSSIFNLNKETINLDAELELNLLLSSIQSEVHRFAIDFHKRKRSSEFFK